MPKWRSKRIPNYAQNDSRCGFKGKSACWNLVYFLVYLSASNFRRKNVSDRSIPLRTPLDTTWDHFWSLPELIWTLPYLNFAMKTWGFLMISLLHIFVLKLTFGGTFSSSRVPLGVKSSLRAPKRLPKAAQNGARRGILWDFLRRTLKITKMIPKGSQNEVKMIKKGQKQQNWHNQNKQLNQQNPQNQHNLIYYRVSNLALGLSA